MQRVLVELVIDQCVAGEATMDLPVQMGPRASFVRVLDVPDWVRRDLRLASVTTLFVRLSVPEHLCQNEVNGPQWVPQEHCPACQHGVPLTGSFRVIEHG